MKLEDFGVNSEIQTKADRCETHGDYVSRNVFRNIWSGCPYCAAERQAVQQREEEERASSERFRAWQKRLGEAAIPERFYTRTLDSYIATSEDQRRALEFSQAYADNFEKAGSSAIFCGRPGTGKTHLAVGIGLHLMKHNKLVLFTTVQRLVRRVKDSWNDNKQSEGDVIRIFVQPDLLILDEVGVQFGTDFERNLMFDILNERYEKRRATILLSNLTVTEVKSLLGDRVFDRLREDGGQCVPFNWTSHRGEKTLSAETPSNV
jgi:DNA replication protein DnaC